jgi:hypothetical protein
VNFGGTTSSERANLERPRNAPVWFTNLYYQVAQLPLFEQTPHRSLLPRLRHHRSAEDLWLVNEENRIDQPDVAASFQGRLDLVVILLDVHDTDSARRLGCSDRRPVPPARIKAMNSLISTSLTPLPQSGRMSRRLSSGSRVSCAHWSLHQGRYRARSHAKARFVMRCNDIGCEGRQ